MKIKRLINPSECVYLCDTCGVLLQGAIEELEEECIVCRIKTKLTFWPNILFVSSIGITGVLLIFALVETLEIWYP